MITKRHGEPSRLLVKAKSYSFLARMADEEKVLLREAQERLKSKLGDSPSNTILLIELLYNYIKAA